ncbi:hypothetical protein Pse7367_0426 [Thalassoporum mexicanum PCC 7367]|uniref:hypothetical protein n=1 Tax=Thalassoporum mexicanum TaxID=3457544 RepID=UPI00029FEDEC|nr:hypothetical protein [Pseudanabaena sp. PCC 7367]AFY68737.1 hypothetical protein Pse7367_0426 [Pseudanabaena sp. PCC 7367]
MTVEPDLASLEITKTDLRQITGLNPDAATYRSPRFRNRSTFLIAAITLPLVWLAIFILLLQGAGIWSYLAYFSFFWLIVIGPMLLWFLMELEVKAKFTQQMRSQRQQFSADLLNLLEDVNRHNKVIHDIKVLDQLKQAGHQIDIVDRQETIQAVKASKDEILLALRTERILRENPQFNPEHLSVDLTALRSLQIRDRVGEYGKLLNDALQVGINVQQKMRHLQNLDD